MQQFARRQPGDGPGNDPQPAPPVSNEAFAQLLDQVCEVKKHLADLSTELGQIKAENQRLRVQMTGMIAAQEVVEPAAPSAAAPAAPVSVAPPAAPAPEPAAKESIDEEFLVEWVRGSGLQEPGEAPTAATVEEPQAEPEKPEPATSHPLSDDEIQRLLAEAAKGATDASPQPEQHVAPVAAQEEPDDSENESPAEFLRIDDSPIEPAWPFTPDFEVSKEAVAKVPSHLAIGALAVPVRLEGGKIYCKAVVPFDRASIDMIADATACEVVPEPAPIEQVLTALRTAYGDEHSSFEREAAWDVAETAPKRRGLGKLFRRSA